MIKDENININDIISLWSEAFGDSEKDIIFFADNVRNAKCLVCYDCGKPAAMLYLVHCVIDDEDSEYIYAACTALGCRNQGYMTKLLNYVKSNYNSVCLIPAEEWLINYYESRGFTKKIEIDSIRFSESGEIEEYLFEGCELENPFALLYKGD